MSRPTPARLMLGLCATVFLGAACLNGQEETAITWDLDPFPSLTDGRVLLAAFVVAACCWGYWRLLTWLVARWSQRPSWAVVRYVWPTGMLLVLWLGVWGEGPTLVLAIFVAVPIFPALLGAGLVVELLGLAGWQSAAVASLFVWAGWYVILRLLEWRTLDSGLLSLQIKDRGAA